jgi:tRNA dimethylallyltransferase
MRVLGIVGPTATGKSSLAMALAERVGGEIVNADALQVYRGLDVGTAKPTLAERARVRHHLIDILDPVEGYSAGEFVRRAEVSLAEIRDRGRVPIVVGGSGLYVHALTDGLAAMPPVPAAVRTAIEDRWRREGLAALYVELSRRDPETAARLAPGDRQRILRGLEVIEATGKTLSSWLTPDAPCAGAERRGSEVRGGFSFVLAGLTLPRAALYDAIEGRVAAMLRAGWVAEVVALLEAGVPEEAPAFRAIGYRQLVEHVRRGCPLDQAAAAIVVATRRYAKRQMTWFRKYGRVEWMCAAETETNVERLISMASDSMAGDSMAGDSMATEAAGSRQGPDPGSA